jgi:hypothetical protein
MPDNNANSSTKDFEVDRAFVRTKLVGRVDRAACRYCKNSAKPWERSWNTSFMREHLVNCKPYQDLLQSTVKDGDKRPRTMTMRQRIDEDEAARLERRPAIAVAKNPCYVAAAPKVIKQLISCTLKPSSLLAVRSPYLSLLSGWISSTLWDVIPQKVCSS